MCVYVCGHLTKNLNENIENSCCEFQKTYERHMYACMYVRKLHILPSDDTQFRIVDDNLFRQSPSNGSMTIIEGIKKSVVEAMVKIVACIACDALRATACHHWR